MSNKHPLNVLVHRQSRLSTGSENRFYSRRVPRPNVVVHPKRTAVFVRETDHINYLTIIDEHGNEQIIETTDAHPFWVVTDDPDLERAARGTVGPLATQYQYFEWEITINYCPR